MLMDPMGGIVMTNDGNAILREVKKFHPTVKISREKIFSVVTGAASGGKVYDRDQQNSG